MSKPLTWVVFLPLLLLASPVYGTEYLLHPDGSGDFPTIQEAVWASAHGDVLLLSPGDYLESGIDLVGRAITIRALEGSGTCRILGGGENLFLFDSGEDASTVLAGLDLASEVGNEMRLVECINASPTFEDCTFEAGTAAESVALYAVGSGPSLLRCTFRGNLLGAEFRGSTRHPIEDCLFEDNSTGMVFVSGNGLLIQRCEFRGNGRGLAERSGSLFTGDITVLDCHFEGNQVGAALFGPGADCIVRNSSFVRNVVSGASFIVGDLTVESSDFIENGLEAQPSGEFGGLEAAGGEVVDCLFESNRAKHAGGVRGAGRVRGCVFRNNLANGFGEEDGLGGALLGGTTCEESLFESNRGGHGGAIYGGGNTIRDCTFVDNAGYFASAIEFGSQNARAERVIITGSTGGTPIECGGDGTSLVVVCSDLWGNEAGDWVGCVTGQLGQDGNITSDPLFCDPGIGDFTLASTSPCLEQNSGCGTMGAYGEGCTPVPVLDSSWGRIKARFSGSESVVDPSAGP